MDSSHFEKAEQNVSEINDIQEEVQKVEIIDEAKIEKIDTPDERSGLTPELISPLAPELTPTLTSELTPELTARMTSGIEPEKTSSITVEVKSDMKPDVFGSRPPVVSAAELYAAAGNGPTRDKITGGKSLKTAVIIAAVVSILGGGSLGLGIGIGIPISQSYFVSKTAEEAEKTQEPFRFSDDVEKQESTETFAQNTTSQNNIGSLQNSYTASYASIIDKVEPSVVGIMSKVNNSFMNFDIPSEGAGSGILFHEDDKKYYIVTNHHVVSGAESVMVSFAGKGPFVAEPVGKQADSDLSVISISKDDVAKAGVKDVVLAKFGNSDAVSVGDVVLAIGNALGEGNTATNGIISAKDKLVSIDGIGYSAFQTNAAINPGNSGGPLINLNGEVIGINSAKLSSSASSTSSERVEGMGYSIPSNDVKKIIEDLMGPKKPMLGIKGGDMTEALANQFNLPQGGALISEVIAGTPAEAAGLKSKDIITGFNSHTIFTFDDLKNALSECSIGDTSEIKYITNGKDFKTTEVTLFEIVDTDF